MQQVHSSTYRGYFVTTRGVALEPSAAGHGRRFSASFAVDPPDPCRESWQQFLRAVFDSFGAAADNALSGAKKSIDQDIAAAGA